MKSALSQLLSDENGWRSLFGHTEITLDTREGRQAIADVINSKLSPENLTCDGELSRAAVQKRYRYYSQAATELRNLDASVDLWGVV